jgi:hypothetical protein
MRKKKPLAIPLTTIVYGVVKNRESPKNKTNPRNSANPNLENNKK